MALAWRFSWFETRARMYLAVGLWTSIILLMASPVIWVIWWLLADLGERASNRHGITGAAAPQRYRPAA
jgi:hypothetical protein